MSTGFARPHWVEIVAALPKTSTGKIQKHGKSSIAAHPWSKADQSLNMDNRTEKALQECNYWQVKIGLIAQKQPNATPTRIGVFN